MRGELFNMMTDPFTDSAAIFLRVKDISGIGEVYCNKQINKSVLFAGKYFDHSA